MKPSSRCGGPTWDVAVRLAHWLLAALVVLAYFLDDGGPRHRLLGYWAAGVVMARLLWATMTRGSGSLAALKLSIRGTLAYLRAGAPRRIAHDPLGLWMVWFVWLLVILLALTGWLSRLDMFWGDERVHEIHAWIAHVLMGAAALHVLGVVVMSYRWRENLALAMLSGRKRRADLDDTPSK